MARKLEDLGYGGLQARFTTTSAGEVRRRIDPIRLTPCEFPHALHYHNWLTHFLRPDVQEIRLGVEIPSPALALSVRPRAAQYYKFNFGGVEVHDVLKDPKAKPARRQIDEDFQYVVRTKEDIYASPQAIVALNDACQILTTHAVIALVSERGRVKHFLRQGRDFAVKELLGSQSEASELDRVIAAILRSVATGNCDVDWSNGRITAETIIRPTTPTLL